MGRMVKLTLAAAMAAGLVATTAATAVGSNTAAVRASSYINRDTGMPTENPDVNIPSNCTSPDPADVQVLSPAGTAVNNVHNDACLFAADGSVADGPATFESFGVGGISACPDPDLGGPRTAVAHDHNGDGRNEHCHLSGYQLRNAPGDFEYHARLNNTTTPGQQRVLFCADPDTDGCLDERIVAQVAVGWVPPSTSSPAG